MCNRWCGFLKYFLPGRGMRDGMVRRVSASIRKGYLEGKARVRVFNLNLQIKIERGDTVSGWQGGTGQEAAEWVLAERRGEEDRAKVSVWVKIRFEVKLIRILLVPLRPQKWG